MLMPQLQFVANQIQVAQVRRITHTDGRDYLIAPDIPIREGVLNGLYYPANEITAYVDAWNGKPLTLGHPQANGQPISANSPDIFSQSPGFFFNADWRDGRLHGEWWIDIAKAQSIGGDAIKIMERLEAGELIEESTGLFADVEPAEGEYQGTSYSGIARNIRPDHLAILLHETGACSVEDGCGAPRINSQNQNPVEAAFYTEFDLDSVSIEQSFDNVIIARHPDGRLYSHSYIHQDDTITFLDPVEISPVYQTIETGDTINNHWLEKIKGFVSGLIPNSQEDTVNRDVIVTALLANEACPLSRELLDQTSDDELLSLQAAYATNEDDEGDGSPDPDPEPTPDQAPQFELPPALTQFAEMIEGLPGGVDALGQALSGVVSNAQSARTQLVEQIAANSDFAAADLDGMTDSQLSILANTVAAPQTPIPNFAGRGGLTTQASDDEWETVTITREVQ